MPAQIGNFGWELLRLNQVERAQPYLARAADLFEQMGLRDYAERHRTTAVAIEKAIGLEKTLVHANALYEQKDFEGAIEEFRRVIQTAPDARAWNGLASALESLKRYDEAIDGYTHAIEREPNSAYLYRNRANILLDQDRLDEAERDIVRAAELEPEHAFTHARQAELALARGQFVDALTHFQFASEHSDDLDWQFGLAVAQLATGNPDRAQQTIAVALPKANDDNRESARSWLKRVVNLRPELAEAAERIAEMLK
ncbi:MAG: tetratricopeptide repeat protein [Chloroflexi bacterium]|nr:tetratricopeptide repeat protein [Chloroflexota bacterium]